ncbi:hypothetical protein AUEXF2481DRAFT_43718 [Aureobasidium subglaciale EXF-2481]|uniref:Uncharacterized protein n=1 Tax=Aureobasidium subglaciale (strain EXF-2481) TaxID=1043005 RepID=A0A074Y250_AURSE|nr:uncharacterized protein AUEXF2481DRAFT_43718 [Aureobasidium subglaciale EXF-2481]KEQ91785.1 hypothetical protein AUEXF2481DRAFT_43718 [Aureobasidium subglaciale EXF-2481]
MLGRMITQRDNNGDEMNRFSTLSPLPQLAVVAAIPHHAKEIFSSMTWEKGKSSPPNSINFLPIPSFTHLSQITSHNLNNIPQQQVHTQHHSP